MKVPAFLLAAALVFWGWQAGALAVGILAAIAVEVPPKLRWRIDLSVSDFNRIADFCTLLLVAAVVTLGIVRGPSRGLLLAFEWFPLILLPLVVAQRCGRSNRVNLSALIRRLRKLRQRDPYLADPQIDTGWVYLVVTLIATGISNQRGPEYFVATVSLVGWALFATHPRHGRPWLWPLLFALAAGGGYFGYQGLERAQVFVENLVPDWHAGDGQGDAYRSKMLIGQMGEIKSSDEIVARIPMRITDAAPPALLHLASYNRMSGSHWYARLAPMRGLAPDKDNTSWNLGERAGTAAESPLRLRLSMRVARGKLMLALPAWATRITALPAERVQYNSLGAVQAEIAQDWVDFQAQSGHAETYAPPDSNDLMVPDNEHSVLRPIVGQIGAHDLPAAKVVEKVAAYFGEFSYATYRSLPVREISPIADFLTRERKGHCEYFAAATVLLLREAGIPARYATGYAVQEYSDLEDAYVLRRRHAHAWARAHVDGSWIDVDTTPAGWFSAEEQQAPWWRDVVDLVRWASYRMARESSTPMLDIWVPGFLAALLTLLGWRFMKKRRLREMASRTQSIREQPIPGNDSEFFRIERILAARFRPRGAGESLSGWIIAVSGVVDSAIRQRLLALLALHQRYRFDPAGLTPDARRRLATEAAAIETLLGPMPPRR
jgi:protein-glutamine gamma-glutamyltransferase